MAAFARKRYFLTAHVKNIIFTVVVLLTLRLKLKVKALEYYMKVCSKLSIRILEVLTPNG